MKIRNGFVSNSSSSSFLIIKYGSIENKEDTLALIPDFITGFQYLENSKYKEISKEKLAEHLLNNLKKISFNKAVKFNVNGGYLGYVEDSQPPSIKDFTKEFNIDGMDEEEIAEASEKELKNNWKFYNFYMIEAEDDTHFGAFMEHQFLPLISNKRYSHH